MTETTPPDVRFSAIFVRAFAYQLIPLPLAFGIVVAFVALFSSQPLGDHDFGFFLGAPLGALLFSLSRANSTIRVTHDAVVFPPRPFRKARELPLASLEPTSIRLKRGLFGRYIIPAPSGKAFTFAPFIYGPAQTASLLALLRREAVV